MQKDIEGNLRYFGHTMVQFDVYQRPLFFHKNLRKWTTGTRCKHTENREMAPPATREVLRSLGLCGFSGPKTQSM